MWAFVTQHITGIYAQKTSSVRFIVCPEIIRSIRKLEQLRYLEFGKTHIKMVETHVGIGIDNSEDLESKTDVVI
jgi:3-deoxy-manno-octulosonate cytidylyltransferase (CMP-KDO synthetase)